MKYVTSAMRPMDAFGVLKVSGRDWPAVKVKTVRRKWPEVHAGSWQRWVKMANTAFSREPCNRWTRLQTLTVTTKKPRHGEIWINMGQLVFFG